VSVGALVALLAGVGATIALWPALAPLLVRGGFERTNRRGTTVVTAAGVAIMLAGLAAAAVVALLDVAGVDGLPDRADVLLGLLTLLGFGLLGLLDDVLPSPARGWRGHLRALSAGEVTPGLVKLVGGAALGVVVASGWSSSFGGVLRDGALIALAANLANLLDLAPGRTTKVATVAWVALVVGVAVADGGSGGGSALVPASFVVGAAIGLLLPEMRERCMLGDTGANAVGAVVGLAVVGVAPGWARGVVLVALVALNLAGEVVSFSRVIGSVRWLRALDELGARRPDASAP
jgi:UDP-N-acetylmuramyl pentapeptide phosphotransferase/UDP-N-acetylglucosamine-1-phosphate transferase